MQRHLIIGALGLTVAACAPSTHATAFRQIPAKVNPAEVEIFSDSKPDRPYEEVGVIEVSGSELSNARYGDLIERARARAAEMGADAIIVTRNPETHSIGTVYLPPNTSGNGGQLVTATARNIETPRIQVAAIVWKAAPNQ